MSAKNPAGLFSRFFTESDAAMTILDSQGFMIAVNKRMKTLLASLSTSLPQNAGAGGFPLSIRDILGAKQTSHFWPSFSRILSGTIHEAAYGTALRRRHEEEDVVHWYRMRAWLLEKDEGEAQEFQGPFVGLIIEDQTLARQEEKRLLEDKKIAEKAMEAKSQFLANMSHEIRTPIQTVIGLTELLQDTSLDHEQSEYSRQIKFSAEVLLSLINDMLDYSKIEAGKMELEHIDFDLEQNIEQAVDMISLEAHKKGLEIATDIPRELSLMVKGDPNKFRQIVINLVKNAVKFTKEGSVIVTAALTELKLGEAVRVSVADTGIGISEEAKERLFTTFMQADVSNTRRFGGTGLGLVISHDLVELMRGHIEAVPNTGGGSIFRFTIPLERSEAEPPPLPAREGDAAVPILVIDDQDIARNILGSYLADLGYSHVEPAPSGEAALKAMRSAAAAGRPFKLCFIDMNMPVMNGWRLAAEIHNDKTINTARLILMAPQGLMGADTKMTLLKWFKAYINKPIKRRGLADTINAAFREPEGPESLGELEAVADAGAAPAPVPAKPLILITEDHPVNRKLFAMIIDKLGYPSILAGDGLEALEQTQAHPEVGLIFMDIQMPRMNGYEAAENLRKQGFDKPIIAVTAGAFPDEEARCLSAGMDDMVIKPFKRPDIEKSLLKWIGGRGGAKAAPKSGEASAMPLAMPVRAAPAGAEPAAEIFSPAELLDTFMGNDDMALSFLHRFVTRTAAQIEGIPGLKEREDWDSARREAHSIKGAAYTMTGKELGTAAARLEGAFKNRDQSEMDAAYGPLAESFGRFRIKAGAFLKSRDFTPAPDPPAAARGSPSEAETE